jgi:hypothetical protein
MSFEDTTKKAVEKTTGVSASDIKAPVVAAGAIGYGIYKLFGGKNR